MRHAWLLAIALPLTGCVTSRPSAAWPDEAVALQPAPSLAASPAAYHSSPTSGFSIASCCDLGGGIGVLAPLDGDSKPLGPAAEFHARGQVEGLGLGVSVGAQQRQVDTALDQDATELLSFPLMFTFLVAADYPFKSAVPYLRLAVGHSFNVADGPVQAEDSECWSATFGYSLPGDRYGSTRHGFELRYFGSTARLREGARRSHVNMNALGLFYTFAVGE
jgi:hypothetical protein